MYINLTKKEASEEVFKNYVSYNISPFAINGTKMKYVFILHKCESKQFFNFSAIGSI